MHGAREALWQLLHSAKTLAPQSARAMLFARLCGVHGAEFSDARVERVLRVARPLGPPTPQTSSRPTLHLLLTHCSGSHSGQLTQLYPESARRVREVMAEKATHVPMHGLSANISVVLSAMQKQDEIGADDRAAIVQLLEAAAVPDPKAAHETDKMVGLDEALLAVIDRHDKQRAVSNANLRGVFAHFDESGDGFLDLDEFKMLMHACDDQLSDDQVRSIFLDCVKASKKINKELEEGQIIQQGFLQVCELYGLHMQVQSTVVTKGGSPAGVRGK